MEQGKTALIIGASRGLGAGLTRELATRGWTVVATQRRPSAELQQLAGDLGTVDIETVDIQEGVAGPVAPEYPAPPPAEGQRLEDDAKPLPEGLAETMAAAVPQALVFVDEAYVDFRRRSLIGPALDVA